MLYATMVVRAVGLEEVDLHVQRLLGEGTAKEVRYLCCHVTAQTLAVDTTEAEAFDVLSDMLQAEEVGLVAMFGERRGGVQLVGVELPAEGAM